eukprot:jgi/Bigna1/78183/fgenesh1_pg.53_\
MEEKLRRWREQREAQKKKGGTKKKPEIITKTAVAVSARRKAGPSSTLKAAKPDVSSSHRFKKLTRQRKPASRGNGVGSKKMPPSQSSGRRSGSKNNPPLHRKPPVRGTSKIAGGGKVREINGTNIMTSAANATSSAATVTKPTPSQQHDTKKKKIDQSSSVAPALAAVPYSSSATKKTGKNSSLNSSSLSSSIVESDASISIDDHHVVATNSSDNNSTKEDQNHSNRCSTNHSLYSTTKTSKISPTKEVTAASSKAPGVTDEESKQGKCTTTTTAVAAAAPIKATVPQQQQQQELTTTANHATIAAAAKENLSPSPSINVVVPSVERGRGDKNDQQQDNSGENSHHEDTAGKDIAIQKHGRNSIDAVMNPVTRSTATIAKRRQRRTLSPQTSAATNAMPARRTSISASNKKGCRTSLGAGEGLRYQSPRKSAAAGLSTRKPTSYARDSIFEVNTLLSRQIDAKNLTAIERYETSLINQWCFMIETAKKNFGLQENSALVIPIDYSGIATTSLVLFFLGSDTQCPTAVVLDEGISSCCGIRPRAKEETSQGKADNESLGMGMQDGMKFEKITAISKHHQQILRAIHMKMHKVSQKAISPLNAKDFTNSLHKCNEMLESLKLARKDIAEKASMSATVATGLVEFVVEEHDTLVTCQRQLKTLKDLSDHLFSLRVERLQRELFLKDRKS